MIEQGPATENDMVVAFLRAEIDSSRFGKHIRIRLAERGLDRHLIDEPNLADVGENSIRKQILASFRGYGVGRFLFDRFPEDATWRRVRLELHDFETLRYADYKTWVDFSDGTRLVSIGGRNFRRLPHDSETCHMNAITEALRNGVRFPELIAAQHHDGSLILIEGHSRATVYVMEQFEDVDVLVASSLSMPKWFYY